MPETSNSNDEKKLEDILHAVNMYLAEVAEKGDIPTSCMSALRLTQSVEKVRGIMPFPIMLGDSVENASEMVVQAMAHLFATKAKELAKSGYDPLSHLGDCLSGVLAIGTMMGFVVGINMLPGEGGGEDE